MGRPKGSKGKKGDGRDDVAVKIDRIVAGRAKILAGHRGVSLAEFVTELLRGPIDREYLKMMKELEGGDR